MELLLSEYHADILLVRFLDLIKPFSPFLPEVSSPETKVPFNQKLMYVREGSDAAERH